MKDSKLAIEQGLALFRDLIEDEEALSAELAASRVEFFGDAPAETVSEQEALLAERRHLEWFVHERFSESLEGTPVEALLDRWLEQAGVPEVDFAESFLGSRAGVYEVTGVKPGQGAWLRDLVGAGEYPLEEPEAALGLDEGDLVVGRLFPIGDALYRVSPAAACFRNPDLLGALRADVERVRLARRGTPHVSQVELEHMFFSEPAPTAADAVQGAEALLREAGLEEGQRRAALEALAAEVELADPVTGLLEHLAMESSVDLERARRVLIAARAQMMRRFETSPPAAEAEPREERVEAPADPREALREFDLGRAQGRDLELLFGELERRLGLDPEDAEDAEDGGGAEPGQAGTASSSARPAEELAPAPDFPDVVGAMVEEFLWDVEREGGPSARRDLEPVRELGRFARGVESLGVFENLSARDLALFLSCWVVEERVIATAADARRLVEATEAFARWAEEQHELPLATRLASEAPELAANLARVVEANRALPDTATSAREARLGSLRLRDAEAYVELGPGRSEAVTLPAEVLRWVRDGDLVATVPGAAGASAARCVYPPEAGAYLRRG